MTGRRRAKRDGNSTAQLSGAPADWGLVFLVLERMLDSAVGNEPK